MDEVKDKVKGFMKKVNFQSSSSSGRFQGPGRVLGSSSSSSSAPNPYRQTNPHPNSPNPKPLPQRTQTQTSDRPRNDSASKPSPDPKPVDGFDPFGPMITSAKRSQNGYSLEIFECPVCQHPFKSEQEVSEHIETCLGETANVDGENNDKVNGDKSPSDLEASVCAYLSSKPAPGLVEVVLRLLRNIAGDPENPKFRRIRMSNAKIKEAVADVAGGVELLEFLGFELREEDGEMWATMGVPSEDGIAALRRGVQLLESQKVVVAAEPPPPASAPPVASSAVATAEPKKIDRQIKVFFSVPENVAAKIELPDSFYNLSTEEVRREAKMIRKKIADSQLLVPKSYKEKQAKAARKKYKKTMIRVQFPDGVVLQGVFNPWEPTSSLYKFVSSALKEPSLQFELLHPVVIKRRVIPYLPNSTTLEDEDLVPSALVKFRPIETDSIVFTGLCNELLEISEPLVVDP